MIGAGPYRSASAGDSEEGVPLLALRPLQWEWREAPPPPGVVLEGHEIGLTPEAWRYLADRLTPLPPGWPQEVHGELQISVKCLVLAAGMGAPPRFGDGDWLLLSQPDEVADLSALLLNPHGVHFLNHARHSRRSSWHWQQRVAGIHALLERRELSPSGVLIDAGLVLELYGIRRARGIVLLSLEDVGEWETPFRAGDDLLIHHGQSKQQLINDPRYHLVVDGLKFIAFHQLKYLKQRRRRLVDLNDLAMMRALEEGRSWRLYLGRWLDVGLVSVSMLQHSVSRLAYRVGLRAGRGA
ncbi:hypothetical protein ACGTN6_19470 [Halomonas sp. THAF12]|uniref:hypothetical protein n=1 Tax=Halomonas sp. B23F22_10 TaxID=3459515 RepID=UPI00373F5BCA